MSDLELLVVILGVAAVGAFMWARVATRTGHAKRRPHA